MTRLIQTRFWAANIRYRFVKQLDNIDILSALLSFRYRIFARSKFKDSQALNYWTIFGAEDEVWYQSYKDDNPKSVNKSGLWASFESVVSFLTSFAGITRIRFKGFGQIDRLSRTAPPYGIFSFSVKSVLFRPMGGNGYFASQKWLFANAKWLFATRNGYSLRETKQNSSLYFSRIRLVFHRSNWC